MDENTGAEKLWKKLNDVISLEYGLSKKNSFNHSLTPKNLIQVLLTTEKYMKSHEFSQIIV